MCALVNTNDCNNVYESKSLIIIPMNAPGVTKAKKIDKMGMHSSDTGLIYFDNVRVPLSNTIGEEGAGFFYQMLQFQEERLAAALGCLTPLENCLQETIQYTKERQAFGQAILDNQYVHYRCGD